MTAPLETDALVVGAGPVGLFQVFQLGLQDIRCHVVDSLPEPGGQCVALYADKPIYDIPGVPVCTGRELAALLQRQAAPFAPAMHLGQTVTKVARQVDGRLLVGSSAGTQWLVRLLFVAGGVGAFEPRRLKVPGLDRHEGSQVRYLLADPATAAGLHVVVAGGGEEAVAQALALSDTGPHRAASVTLLHRRDVFQADEGALAELRARIADGRMHVAAGQVQGIEEDAEGALAALQVDGGTSGPRRLPLDLLLVAQGLSPKLGPIADWGLGLERKQVVVDAATLQTSEPGIYAAGDLVTYPGKRKLILCGFHEATLAAYAAAAVLRPGEPVLVQYTTTSPRLQALLGVRPAS